VIIGIGQLCTAFAFAKEATLSSVAGERGTCSVAVLLAYNVQGTRTTSFGCNSENDLWPKEFTRSCSLDKDL